MATGTGGTESVAALRYRKAELEKAMFELAGTLTTDDEIAQYDEQFSAMAAEISEINGKITTVEQEAGEAELQSADAQAFAAALECAPLELQVFDNGLARQLIDTVQVVDEGRIRVHFRDGSVSEQSLC